MHCIFKLLILTVFVIYATKPIIKNTAEEQLIRYDFDTLKIHNISCKNYELYSAAIKTAPLCDDIQNRIHNYTIGSYLCNGGRSCTKYKFVIVYDNHTIPLCTTTTNKCHNEVIQIPTKRAKCCRYIKNRHCSINIMDNLLIKYKMGYYDKMGASHMTYSSTRECYSSNNSDCLSNNKDIFDKKGMIYYYDFDTGIFNYDESLPLDEEMHTYNKMILSCYCLIILFYFLKYIVFSIGDIARRQYLQSK
jgi:hypothetical protein